MEPRGYWRAYSQATHGVFMRVLFIPLAAPSHYYPMAPLAWAFRTANHEVRVAGQPPVIDSIVRSGMIAVPVGGSGNLLSSLERSEKEFHRRTGKRLADFREFSEMPPKALQAYIDIRRAAHIESAEAMAKDIIAFTEFWHPDLIISDQAAPAGSIVAQVIGVPLVQHSWGLNLPAAKLPRDQAPAESWLADLRKIADQLGADFRSDYRLCTVHPCPRSLQAIEGPGQLLARYVPYNGSGVVPDWLQRSPSRPRVCVCWSLSGVALSGGDGILPKVINALATLDVDIVATVNAADEKSLQVIPPGVQLIQELPLQIVAPTCALVVSHGGTGTVLTVASYGIPQLIIPQEQSQHFNAERIAHVGAGMPLQAQQANTDGIARSVSRILSGDEWYAAARRLQEENAAQPGPAETMRAIERLCS